MVGIMLGGVREAYKSSEERYKLKWYNRKGEPKLGFIKCALEAQVPIQPMCYVGSEEIFFVSRKKTKFFIKTGLINYEMPYVIFKPFPYKIYEVYAPPIYLDYPPSAADDEELLLKIFADVKAKFEANMRRGFQLKEENARKYAKKLFRTDNPRVVKLIKPFC